MYSGAPDQTTEVVVGVFSLNMTNLVICDNVLDLGASLKKSNQRSNQRHIFNMQAETKIAIQDLNEKRSNDVSALIRLDIFLKQIKKKGQAN